MYRATTVAASAALLLLAGTTGATAVSAPCSDAAFSPDVTDRVTPTAGCEIDPAIANDSPTAQFLAGEWFGFTDWLFDAKANADDTAGGLGTIDEGDNQFGLSLTPSTGDELQSGSWEITDPDGNGFGSANFMLVFKDGNASPAPLVSYLVGDVLSGTYETPFFNNDDDVFDDGKDISHVSLWYREDGNQGGDVVIPLPAAGWMLLSALGAMGYLGSRARRAD